jgi:SAM-dependent methyltransferase
MTGWGGGYITDVAYTAGFYRLQSPAILSLACLLNGVPTIDPDADEPLSYLELGCGMGHTAMVLAACNPAWQVTAVDFNPGHIAAARQLARDAGLANVRFLEADLASLAEDPQARDIPVADVVSFHGLWSWVSPSVRRGIVRLLAAKVRAGGMVHVSYNALPAWQGAIGLRHVLREAGRKVAARSDRQAQAGVQFAQSLLAAEALQLKQYSFATGMLDGLSKASGAYLAHEYMHDDWCLCFHAEVVADFAEAKLDWVGSASLPENFRQLMLTEAQRALADQYDDPLMAELVKDMCLPRGLRQDVFVRGARRVSNIERNAALGEVRLALTRLPAQMDYEAEVPVGRATLEPAFYRPIVTALGEAPRRVRELIALPDVVGRRDNPAELIAMLVGTDQGVPVTPRPPSQDEPAIRLNRAVARRLVRPETLAAHFGLASTRFGAALYASGLELLVFAKLSANPREIDLDAWGAEATAGREGTDPEKLRKTLDSILEQRVPVWRQLGILE